MKYMLSRKRKNESEWKSCNKGDMSFIITVLQLNMESLELIEFEWKIEPII